MVFAHAFRSLRRTPVYSLAVVLTLALGLAAMGSMLAVVQGVLLAPLPYGESDRLVDIHLEMADGVRVSHSPAVRDTYRRLATQLEDIALYRTGSANVWTGSEDMSAENLTASWVTASTIGLLQVPPLLGRGFSQDEERRGGPEAIILSEAEWRTRFGAKPDVIGERLIVNDVSREIVGVMPAHFSFPGASTRMWLPAKHVEATTAGDFLYAAVARLKPGATLESAQRELVSILPKLGEFYPRLQSGGSTAQWLEETRTTPRVQALRDTVTSNVASTLWMLAIVAALVFLVAWANVANLFLVRADARRQDFALRQALGASPLRASAQVLAESILLGAGAAALAVSGSLGAIAMLVAFGPADFPRLAELTIGPSTLVAVGLVTLLGTVASTTMLMGIIRSGRLSNTLRAGARSQTAGKFRQRLRAGVTVLQIAGALVVLAGSAVLARTAQRLHDVHPGFDAEAVTTFRVLLPFARYDDVARVGFYAQLTQRLERHPAVVAAGLTAKLPLGAGNTPQQTFLIEGENRPRMLTVNVVGNGYFSAMRIPVIAGRDFQALELQRPGELVISRRAATTLFAGTSGADVLGRTLRLDPGGPDYTIVGVVGDVRNENLATLPSAMVYRPQVVAMVPAVQPGPLPGMTLAVRSQAPPEVLVDIVRSVVRDLDPSIPVFEVSSLREVVRRSTASLTLTLWVMTAAALATLLLGTIGLYGVMAYVVALRTREFGLRITLGADPGRITRWVVVRGLVLTAIGLALGLVLFGVAAAHLHATTYAVAAWDPLAITGAMLLLASTAAIACFVPALRAAAVDPAQALRAD